MGLCGPLTQPCLEKNLIEGKEGMEREREKSVKCCFFFFSLLHFPSRPFCRVLLQRNKILSVPLFGTEINKCTAEKQTRSGGLNNHRQQLCN